MKKIIALLPCKVFLWCTRHHPQDLLAGWARSCWAHPGTGREFFVLTPFYRFLCHSDWQWLDQSYFQTLTRTQSGSASLENVWCQPQSQTAPPLPMPPLTPAVGSELPIPRQRHRALHQTVARMRLGCARCPGPPALSVLSSPPIQLLPPQCVIIRRSPRTGFWRLKSLNHVLQMASSQTNIN